MGEGNEKSWNFIVNPVFFLQSKADACAAGMYHSLEPKWLLGNMADAKVIAALQGELDELVFSWYTMVRVPGA